jgi:5-methylcytosine-specific restriction endonuclease McrA
VTPAEYNRAYYVKHAERLKARQRKRYASSVKNDPEQREASRTRARAWYYANKARAHEAMRAWAAKNPDKVRAWHAKQREEHPERRTSYEHARRAKGAGTMDPARVAELLVAERCHYCATMLVHGKRKKGDPYEPRRVTIDHLLPLSRGGTNASKNLVASCARCNFRKNVKTAEEFSAVLERAA